MLEVDQITLVPVETDSTTVLDQDPDQDLHLDLLVHLRDQLDLLQDVPQPDPHHPQGHSRHLHQDKEAVQDQTDQLVVLDQVDSEVAMDPLVSEVMDLLVVPDQVDSMVAMDLLVVPDLVVVPDLLVSVVVMDLLVDPDLLVSAVVTDLLVVPDLVVDPDLLVVLDQVVTVAVMDLLVLVVAMDLLDVLVLVAVTAVQDLMAHKNLVEAVKVAASKVRFPNSSLAVPTASHPFPVPVPSNPQLSTNSKGLTSTSLAQVVSVTSMIPSVPKYVTDPVFSDIQQIATNSTNVTGTNGLKSTHCTYSRVL